MKWLGGSIAIAVMLLSGCDCGGGKGDSDARWLDLEIERQPVEKPAASRNQYGEIGEDGLLTNTYIVPQSFLTSVSGGSGGGVPAPDPFAAPPPPSLVQKKISAREVLEAYGVDFGPGTNAHYDLKKRSLRVTQTPDQMDLVEAIAGSIYYCGRERTIGVHCEIYELPAMEALKLEQSAGERFEHSREHNAILEQVRDETARIVTSARLLCRSGQRARIEDAAAVRHASGSAKAGKDDSNPPLPVFAVTNVGTVMEVDPILGPDDRTIDVNLEVSHHLAPPVWPEGSADSAGGVGTVAQQFFAGALSASELMIDGQVKLLCSWAVPSTPGTDGEPLRRLVFMTAYVVRN